MASTVPAKSQPLHNFTLPHLKWNKDGNSSGHHQRRRSIKSPSRRPNISAASPVRHSPLRDSVSATPPRHQSPFLDSTSAASPDESPVRGDYSGKQSPTPGESSKPYQAREWVKHSPSGVDPVRHLPRHDSASESEASRKGKGDLVEHRRNHHSKNLTSEGMRNRLHSTNSDRAAVKSEGKSRAKEVDRAGIKRSKILIKIPCKSNKTEENPQDEPPKIDNNDEDDGTDEPQEEEKINNNNIDEETKTWNLRPRRPIHKSLNVNGGTLKNNGSPMPERSKAPSPMTNLSNRSGENDGNSGGNGGKKEKRKLSISIPLTKEEIEEDIFSLTGSKPARRPRKRAKNIQRQVDNCFPGLWLVSITADSYKVSENSLKG